MKKTRQSILLLVLLLATVMLLGACGKKTVQDDGSAEEAATISEFIDIEGGASMDDATMLQTNTRYHGQYVEGEYWVCFKTGVDEDATYTVTLLNRSVGSRDLVAILYDEEGTLLQPTKTNCYTNSNSEFTRAGQDGTPATGWIDELEPDTAYYLCLQGNDKVHFTLCITDPSCGAVPELKRETLSADEDLPAATNMEDAQLVQVNGKYHGKYLDGTVWFAFRTGDDEDAEYTVTLENLKVGSRDLVAILYDEEGTLLQPTKTNCYTNSNAEFARAGQDGTPATGWIDELQPNTTYYLCLDGDSIADFNLKVGGPSDSAAVPEGEGEESYLHQDGSIEPGSNQSAAVNVPLGTKVYGKYTSGYAWLSFTTTGDENAEYRITAVNCSVGSRDLVAILYDEEGTLLQPTKTNCYTNSNSEFTRAGQDGKAASGWITELKPNTKYYVRMESNGKVNYSLLVSVKDAATSTGVGTSGDLSAVQGTLSANEPFTAGTNQNNATLLRANTKYHGEYIDGYAWVSFRTGSEENAEYSVTLENLKVGSRDLVAKLYDEEGTLLQPTKTNCYTNSNSEFTRADQDGTPATGWTDELQPNTTYYLCLQGNDKTEFNLTINAPEPEQSGTTMEAEQLTTTAVFAVPYELNETQVNFVANQAAFLYPEQAKAALAPVAEVLLAHPEAKVLLAGTTAKVKGDQASSAVLSEQRAQAVKDMLVKDFSVPESQILVIGLGFEKDPFVRGQEWDANGNFVETEAAKNRRVVIINAETPTAKQLLGG